MNNVQLLEMSKQQSISKRGMWQVILHDDHNSIDHVIDCLLEICGHNYIQSVQCATIAHNTKQCSIFTDSYEECVEVQQELEDYGLTSTISKYKKHV